MTDPNEDGELLPRDVDAFRAACRLWDRGERLTVRSIGRELGVSSPSTAHLRVRRLLGVGLLVQDRGRVGTLRLNVGVVRVPSLLT